MKGYQIAEALGLSCLCGDGGREVKGCYIGDMLSRVMSCCGEGYLWITIQASQNMLAVAEFAEAACVVLPEGVKLSQPVLERGSTEGITVYSSDLSAFELALKIGPLLG